MVGVVSEWWCFFLMKRRALRVTRTDTLFPYAALFGSDLEARRSEAGQMGRARPWPRREIEIARREARQADRRQQRPHRQIFAVGHQMRLVKIGRAHV